MPQYVTVTGLREVQRMLTEAPRLVVSNAYLKALGAAADVLEAALYSAAPERDEGSRDENIVHLKDAIVREIQLDSRFRGGTLDVGFGKEGFRALWVEYGHRMLTHDKRPTKLGMVPPHPFMRPAFEACADQCIEAFALTLERELRSMYGQ
jgi:HK97 gp10 family phage protein